jgi:hypothetical protein
MQPATGNIAPTVGIVLLCLTIVLVIVGTVLLFGGGALGRVLWGLPGGSGLWALGFSLAGYPITRRHPANPVGWCLMVAGVASGVNLLGSGVTGVAALDDLPLWLVNTWVVAVGALCTAVVLFPSGSPPSRWWWAQLALLWGCGCLEYFMAYERGAGFVGLPERLDVLATPADIVFQLSLAGGFLALLVRWRRSGAVERQQLKWVVYTVALLATTAIVVEVGISNFVPDLYFAGTVALCIAILAVPLAIGVAMLRYRLYDIDAVINRTLVYGALTASLVLLYVGGVVGLQYVFRTFAGGGSQLAVVASTLLIAALFNPLRHRIQLLIDRRFYRRKYDARKTLETFSSRLRDETNLEQLNAALLAVVSTTMQPEHVSLWLKPADREMKR